MPNRIELRGVIVPSMFDDAMFEDDIRLGRIMPESRFRTSVESADKQSDMELYINSPGGNVKSADEMLNTLIQWQTETGRRVNITIGAISASAASVIAAMLGPVKAHENTDFMFHGASGERFGGEGAMRDAADRIQQVNRKTISALITKYNIDTETVMEWFSEGRMGWLNAQEAQDIGLVSEIIPVNDEPISFAPMDVQNLQQNGLAIAAMLEDPENAVQETTQQEDKAMEFLKKLMQRFGVEKEDELEAKVEELETQARDADEAYEEGFAAGKAEKLTAALSEERAKLDEEKADLTAKLEASEKAVQTSQREARAKAKELENAEARIEALTGGFDDPDTDEANGTSGSYWDVVEALVTDEGMSKDAAMLKVQREQPALHKQMLDAAQKK